MKNLTVKEFVNRYFHPLSDIKIIKDSKVVFNGRAEIVLDMQENILNNVVKKVGASSGYIVLKC